MKLPRIVVSKIDRKFSLLSDKHPRQISRMLNTSDSVILKLVDNNIWFTARKQIAPGPKCQNILCTSVRVWFFLHSVNDVNALPNSLLMYHEIIKLL